MTIKISRSDISPDSPLEIDGFTVSIIHDDSAENPWDMWDGMPPMLTHAGHDRLGGITEHANDSDNIGDFFSFVSPAWVSRHWRKVSAILDWNESQFDNDAKEGARDYEESLSSVRVDMLRESLEEESNGNAGDYFDKLESLYKLAKIPALSFQRNGYSQGDWTTGIIVHTPRFAKECGYKKTHDVQKDMESSANLYGAWCFGDVYGYSIEDSDGEHVDSCFGFYGSYYSDESDVISEAESALVHAIEKRKKERLDTVKRLIRNRVPLDARLDILAA